MSVDPLELQYIAFLRDQGYKSSEFNSDRLDTTPELLAEVEQVALALGYANTFKAQNADKTANLDNMKAALIALGRSAASLSGNTEAQLKSKLETDAALAGNIDSVALEKDEDGNIINVRIVNLDFLDKRKGISAGTNQRAKLNIVHHELFRDHTGQLRDTMNFLLGLMKLFAQLQLTVGTSDLEKKKSMADQMFAIAGSQAENVLQGALAQVADIQAQYESRTITLIVEAAMFAAALLMYFIPIIGAALGTGAMAALTAAKGASLTAVIIATIAFLLTLFSVFETGGPFDNFLKKFIKDPKARAAILAAFEVVVALVSLKVTSAAKAGAKVAGTAVKAANTGAKVGRAARAVAKVAQVAGKLGKLGAMALKFGATIGKFLKQAINLISRAANFVKSIAIKAKALAQRIMKFLSGKIGGALNFIGSAIKNTKAFKAFMNTSLGKFLGRMVQKLKNKLIKMAGMSRDDFLIGLAHMQMTTKLASGVQKLFMQAFEALIEEFVQDEELKVKLKLVAAIVSGIIAAVIAAKAGGAGKRMGSNGKLDGGVMGRFANSSAGAGFLLAQSVIGLAQDIHGAVRGFQEGDLKARTAEIAFQTAVLGAINDLLKDDQKADAKVSKEFMKMVKKIQGALQKALDSKQKAIGMARQAAA